MSQRVHKRHGRRPGRNERRYGPEDGCHSDTVRSLVLFRQLWSSRKERRPGTRPRGVDGTCCFLPPSPPLRTLKEPEPISGSPRSSVPRGYVKVVGHFLTSSFDVTPPLPFPPLLSYFLHSFPRSRKPLCHISLPRSMDLVVKYTTKVY